MPSGSPQSDPGYRGQATRILMGGFARGDIQARDREYLAKLVAARTGLSQQEAQARVDQTITEAREAAARAETEARIAADKARKAGILAAFLAAASAVGECWCRRGRGGPGRASSRRSHRRALLRRQPTLVRLRPQSGTKHLPPLSAALRGLARAALRLFAAV